MILAGSDIVCAGQAGIAQVARVERLPKAKIRCLEVLLRQIGGGIVRHYYRVVSLFKVCQIASVFGEAWEDLPAQAVTECEPAAELVFILAEEAVLPSCSGHVGAGNRKEDRCGQPFKKVSKSVAGKCWLKSELPEIIGRQERFNVGIANSASINTSLQSVLASRPAQIVGQLERLRLRHAGLVAANGSESGAGAEIERGKGVGGGMLADIYPSQIELRKRGYALDGKTNAGRTFGKPKTELFKGGGGE